MKNLLIIDDNEELLTLLQDYFETLNYDVSTAINSSEASQYMCQENYDIILTDILMPGKDGLELVLEIQDQSGHRPVVIAMTGGGFNESGMGFLEAAEYFGADFTITKPFDLEDLLELVESCTSDGDQFLEVA
jgi:DNA-binding response OmpR family regulator